MYADGYRDLQVHRKRTIREEYPMRVVVDHSLCEGNGRCAEVAPGIFELRDDDQSYVLEEQPPGSLRAKVDLAVSLCPRQAVKIIED
jgi:ferredoxin